MCCISNLLFSTVLIINPILNHADLAALPVYQQIDSTQALSTLQEDYWNFIITESPEEATFAGVPGEHGKWTDFSKEAYERRLTAVTDFLDRLHVIDRATLSSKQHQFQYDILDWMLTTETGKSEHPKWSMEALVLHEALPGHHFQLTVSQLIDVPKFQKRSFTTAFVEGWGRYSESLGKELVRHVI